MTPDSRPFDTIICIGAGPGDQVDAWLATGVTRIILVEPNPAHRPALTALAAAHSAVEVTRAAIAAHDGKGHLHVFNLARHSSLRSPSVLTDLLPGLLARSCHLTHAEAFSFSHVERPTTTLGRVRASSRQACFERGHV